MAGIPIDYFCCLFCGFVFTTDFDTWTREEFASLVYNADYIKVDGEYTRVRPERTARDAAQWLTGCEQARILDYGSGSGVFVDRMRALGFPYVEGYDPYSSPTRPTGQFDIVTCFEVFEHSPDPVATLGEMKSFLYDDGCILFSQTVHPPDIHAVRGSWWYLAPRNGHISTYSEEALGELARRHGMTLHRGSNLYAFAPPWPSSFAYMAARLVGPAFTTLRLLAPAVPSSQAITFPSPDDILWHPVEDDGIWRFRWTGARTTWWEARWGAVDAVQVRVPVLRGVEPGFAEHCALELLGTRKPARLDRGELVADFSVAGVPNGAIALHMPSPADPGGDRVSGSHGLAILVTQSPIWPAHQYEEPGNREAGHGEAAAA
jgi:SAM-dependent methyltransferase